jgi:hypothetical protein
MIHDCILISSGVPRFHKFDFPTYDGFVDSLGWLHRCEQFFRGQCTLEADKVWIAAYHLVDNAQFWYLQFERDHGIPAWQHFKEACHLQFGPSGHANPLAKLARPPFTSTVADYTSRFMAPLCGEVAAGEVTGEVAVEVSMLMLM